MVWFPVCSLLFFSFSIFFLALALPGLNIHDCHTVCLPLALTEPPYLDAIQVLMGEEKL